MRDVNEKRKGVYTSVPLAENVVWCSSPFYYCQMQSLEEDVTGKLKLGQKNMNHYAMKSHKIMTEQLPILWLQCWNYFQISKSDGVTNLWNSKDRTENYNFKT